MPDWSGGKAVPEVTGGEAVPDMTGGSADRDAAAPDETSPSGTTPGEAPAAAQREEEAESAPND
ncbi:hypothetical protein [Kitasatospora sp. NPDC017646]|uniref:hypothetical protein n=1 Tax=Kitasatospora sp. NPDC017646 TaxID=3364024 RepID=UPI00379FB55A